MLVPLQKTDAIIIFVVLYFKRLFLFDQKYISA